MKRLYYILASLGLVACGSSFYFSQSDLNSLLYNGYWAMTPIDDIHRVIKFQPTGAVQIYDYQCEDNHYRLNEIQTYYLSKIKPNLFTIFDQQKKPFARFEIMQVSPKQFQAKQQFMDNQIEKQNLHLNYTHTIEAKPNCND